METGESVKWQGASVWVPLCTEVVIWVQLQSSPRARLRVWRVSAGGSPG